MNTPLSHTNFLPLFTHVNVLAALTLLIPALLQGLPALIAAEAPVEDVTEISPNSKIQSTTLFLII
jgi:hypothetical protein